MWKKRGNMNRIPFDNVPVYDKDTDIHMYVLYILVLTYKLTHNSAEQSGRSYCTLQLMNITRGWERERERKRV